jgi:hypothetical protein
MVATIEREAASQAQKHAFDRIHLLLGHFSKWMQENESKVRLSYLIQERNGFGWYVVGADDEFDFDLSKDLTEFGASLIRMGYPIHATLLPGSIDAAVPSDGIVVFPSGQVTVHAE